MKNRTNIFIAIIGILLILISLVIYGVRILETTIPAGSTPQQTEQLIQLYGLNRPVIEQYGAFLFTFLPGLTLLGIYGTFKFQGRDFQHRISTRIFIVMMLLTNTVTMLNFFVTADASLNETPPAFWFSLVDAGLALANFIFLLVIWNGYKWGFWAFGLTSFVLCTLKFVGHLPIIPVLFEFSAVFILFYLIRACWQSLE